MLESLKTDRLLLRRWRESDRLPFQAMNADPRVMEFMPSLLAPVESDALITRIESHFARHGLGLFAAERFDDASFAGFIGLSVPAFDAHFTPAVEIGWRLCLRFLGPGIGDPRVLARSLITHSMRSASTASFPSRFQQTCAPVA